ncbi:MAG: FtsX-like permease family protein [Bacteroidetes bacterium]|nr:FtsX-like permease family protein [Bacteroidota bacterium]
MKESFVLSLQQLWTSKLRTALSLLGVTVGIFSIIAILTAVDGLERNVQDSINKLGDDLVMVQKWPLYTGGKDYPWWKYIERPEADYRDYKYLKSRSQTVDKIAFQMMVPDGVIEYGSRLLRGLEVVGVTHEYDELVKFDVELGRYFMNQESSSGYHVAVIGAEVADELFDEGINPLGKEVTVDNIKVKVIGVMKREGQDILGFNYDKTFILPYELVNKTMSIEMYMADPTIFIQPGENIQVDEMLAEVTGLMRNNRRLRPKEDDNFALVRFSLITQSFGSILGALNIAGWIIGGFALLVGGFGIANIMYVSVKERTNIIGIKKAMGARKDYIVFEFLAESVLLCVIGGLLGLLIISLLLKPVSNASGFQFLLSGKNVMIGIGVSAVIGLIAGILPAIRAAGLDPVNAIRAK